jgi:hypothetical protein
MTDDFFMVDVPDTNVVLGVQWIYSIGTKVYKDEIQKTIKELLKIGHIRPSSSPFASFVVLVKKKDDTL